MGDLGPSGAIVWGNDQGQVFFIDSASGALIGQKTFLFGSLTAAATFRGALVFCGEGATQGTGFLHAYDLAQGDQVVDLWQPGIQVSGSLDASPFVQGNRLYVALDDGFLLVYDLSDLGQPRNLQQLDVLQLSSGTSRVTGLLPSVDGGRLFLVTAAGVYGVDIDGPKATVVGSAMTTTDFTSVPALVDGELLIVASGSTIYAFDTGAAPAAGTFSPLWSFIAQAPVAGLFPLGGRQMLAADAGATFYLLDNANAQSLGTFDLQLPSGAIAQTVFANDQVVALSPAGDFDVYEFAVGAGGIVTSLYWSLQESTGFTGPPLIVGTVVYAFTTGGTVYAYDLGAKQSLFSQSVVEGSSLEFYAGSAGALVQQETSAAVRFLLDGEAYFPVLRDLLIAVLNDDLAPPASLPDNLTIEGLVKAIGNAGRQAFVMMWDTSLAYFVLAQGDTWTSAQLAKTIPVNQFARLFSAKGSLRGDFRHNAQTLVALRGVPNVQVFLEPYQSRSNYWYSLPVELGSNHQKIGIFSIGGTKLALVSGFNTITPSYYDSPEHPMTDGAGNYDGHSWHDTGLLLQGDTVELIEKEFDRRWAKSGTSSATASGTYVKFANWMIARNSCLDANDVCYGNPKTPPTPYQDPSLSSPPVATRVLITSNETVSVSSRVDPTAILTEVAAIEDALVLAIGAAARYAYFENFTFQSVAIVRALYQNLSAAGSSLQLIVVVPAPTQEDRQGSFTLDKGELTAVRVSYAVLKIASDDWTSFFLEDGESVAKSDPVQVNFDDRGIEFTTITFTKGASERTVSARAVVSFEPAAAAPQVIFCSPARYFTTPPPDSGNELLGYPPNFRAVYVHSKLALIDDEMALIGSANFSKRSMRNDGELSVMIQDPTAKDIRQALFAHWNMGTVADWYADMQAFAQSTEQSLGILELDYRNLPDWTPTWAWYYLTTIMDPSDLL